MSKEIENKVTDLAVNLITIAWQIGNMFLSAYVVMMLLGWFISDVVGYQFGYFHSMGVSLTVGFLSRGHVKYEKTDPVDGVKSALMRTCLILLTLLIGWMIS